MAEAGQQRAVTAAFPPPPPFWKHFSSANLEKLEELKKEECSKNNKENPKTLSPADLRSLPLPPELRYLVPPEPPQSGFYNLFGEAQSVSTNLPSLTEQGIEQLYPSPPTTQEGGSPPLNHAYYLLKISKSLLLNFLEFVGVLSVEPQEFQSKLDDLRNLFVNAHHLLNLYRPHQARESLIMMMEEQRDRSREEIKEMDRVKKNVEDLLERLKTDGITAGLVDNSQDTAKDTAGDETPKASQNPVSDAKRMWKLLADLKDD
ncbi:Mediator of RNA polymerase II transcription subunit 7 [Arachnomyces sp. PD_36]|nr:Mediator of RNA polymerase II transcription subunit 7 [Arachnomyces sp. PD_36]